MKNTDVKIIQFESQYRDDLIFMILEAKNALGRVPGLNGDLLDIEKHYFAKGDKFWIAVNERDRVIGSVGYNSIPDTSEIQLHRLFVKANLKHQGIGTKLLATAEAYAKEHGKTAVYVHLGTPKEHWKESYGFYPKNGYMVYDEAKPNYMKKELI